MEKLLYAVGMLGYIAPDITVVEYIMKQKNTLWELTELLIVAGILAVIIRLFVVSAYTIPSGSMLETLQVGDYILVTRFNYDIKVPFTDISITRTGDPGNGDIIVFRYPEDPSQDFVKRVIGIPGDTIEIRDKMVFRNGNLVKEPYTQFTEPYSRKTGIDNVALFTVPADQYYVLGDNRDNSKDSRYWGFVPRENIHGKSWIVHWSWDSSRPGFRYNILSKTRWERLFTFLYPEKN